MPAFAEAKNVYTGLVARAGIKPAWQSRIDAAARYIIANRSVYEKVQAATGVPWDFVGALHWRESNGNFRTHLHNGDSLAKKTWRVPAGRPPGNPPFDWFYSAIDALKMKHMDQWHDWSMEGRAFKAEEYNGWGYWGRHPSPYLWSGTDVYTRGKFYEDRKYSSTIVDAQVGVMPIMLRIKDMTKQEVVEQNSRKVGILRRSLTAVQALFGAVGTVFTLDNLGVFTGWLAPISGFIDPKTLAIVVVGGLAFSILAIWLINLTHQDYAQGRYDPSGIAPNGAEKEEVK